MMKRWLVLVLLGACRSSAPAVSPLQVAAAADLKPAFEALGRTFTSRTGVPVSFTFGSTGLLATQLKEGAPFDLFAAASVEAAKDASDSEAEAPAPAPPLPESSSDSGVPLQR
jgi:molybdate transport system substrate-binding protein